MKNDDSGKTASSNTPMYAHTNEHVCANATASDLWSFTCRMVATALTQVGSAVTHTAGRETGAYLCGAVP